MANVQTLTTNLKHLLFSLTSHCVFVLGVDLSIYSSAVLFTRYCYHKYVNVCIQIYRKQKELCINCIKSQSCQEK